MGSMEQMAGGINHQDQLLLTRNMSQMELAAELQEDPISWLDKHGEDFKILVEEDPEILERLAIETTHHEALEEVKEKIYPKIEGETLH